jgi:hypothetical protein
VSTEDSTAPHRFQNLKRGRNPVKAACPNLDPKHFRLGVCKSSVVDLDPDPNPGGQKCSTKIENKLINSFFECSLLRVEGFPCSLDVL